MRVLVACEFSGVVRDAFLKEGHDAYSCDLLPTDSNPDRHIQDDIKNQLTPDWDLLVAFPPCKYLCNGGANWLNRRPDLKWRENRESAVKFFMGFMNAPIAKTICLPGIAGLTR
jgi:hypothetical protein